VRSATVNGAAAAPGHTATGTGIAIGGWPGGLEPAAALCRMDQDGSLTVVVGSVDMSGSNTALALIAGEAFGVSAAMVRVVNEDSQSAPYAGMSGGSKITYTVGRAVMRAAEDARAQVLAVASDLLEVALEDLEIVDGQVRVIGAPEKSISTADIAAEVYDFGGRFEPVQGRGASAITTNAPGFVAHLAEVAVDPETAHIQVTRYVAIQDVGRAINPAVVEGQIHGGVAQGLGWALYEAMPYDEQGQLMAATFTDYALPAAHRMPAIEPILVEVPVPDGPFGAKGVGEPPIIPGAAAVANAIRDAVGVRMTELPITPDRLFRALQDSRSS
jgi:CO/xanthine dehydrogenase Mo-binding subunit